MKGKLPKTGSKSHPAYAGGKSNVAKESVAPTSGFKRGGKTAGNVSGVMSAAHAGRKPRKSGGSVMSSAATGTPRAKSSCY
jgi:hypothetical protein